MGVRILALLYYSSKQRNCKSKYIKHRCSDSSKWGHVKLCRVRPATTEVISTHVIASIHAERIKSTEMLNVKKNTPTLLNRAAVCNFPVTWAVVVSVYTEVLLLTAPWEDSYIPAVSKK